MAQIKLDLRQLDLLDIRKQAKPITFVESRTKLDRTRATLLKSSVSLAAKLDPRLKAILDYLDISESSLKASVLKPSRVPVGPVGPIPPLRAPTRTTFKPLVTASPALAHMQITFALGLEASFFWVGGVSITPIGLYVSPEPAKEIGLFTSVSPGMWTIMGFGVGPTLTAILGGPSDFSGVSFGIGADLGSEIGVSGGAMLLFSPSFSFLGLQIGIAVGSSIVPSDITIQTSITATTPIVHYK